MAQETPDSSASLIFSELKSKRNSVLSKLDKNFKFDSQSGVSLDDQRNLWVFLTGAIEQLYLKYTDKFTEKHRNVLQGVADYICKQMKENDSDLWDDIVSESQVSIQTDIENKIQNSSSDTVKNILDYVKTNYLEQIKSSIDKKNQSQSSNSSGRVSFRRDLLTTDQRYIIDQISKSNELAHYVNQLYEQIHNAIIDLIKEYRVKFEGRKELVNAITNVLLKVSRKYEKDIRDLYDSFRVDKQRFNQVLDDFRKSVGTEVDKMEIKHDKFLTVRNASISQAFMATLKKNSQWYSKNTNFFFKVMYYRAKKLFNTISDHVKVVKEFVKEKVFHPIRTFKNWFRLWKVVNIAINLHIFVLKVGLIASRIAVNVMIKSVKTAFYLSRRLYQSGRKIATAAIRTVNGIFKTAKNVVFGVTKSIIGAGKSFFTFFTNNTFGKKFAKFLRSDEGAFFLGIVSAFVKVKLIDPLMKLMSSGISFKMKWMDVPDDFGIYDFFRQVGLNNYGGITTITTKIVNFSRKTITKIKELWDRRNKLFDIFNDIELVKTVKSAIKFAKFIVKTVGYALKYRFTTLALSKTPIGMMAKHPLLALFGIGTLFLADTMINSKISNAIGGLTDGLKVKFLSPSEDHSILNRSRAMKYFHTKYGNGKKGNIKLGKEYEKNYIQMIDELDMFEKTTNDAIEEIRFFQTLSPEEIEKSNDGDLEYIFEILNDVNLFNKHSYIGNLAYFKKQTIENRLMILNGMADERNSILYKTRDTLRAALGTKSFEETIDWYRQHTYGGEFGLKINGNSVWNSLSNIGEGNLKFRFGSQYRFDLNSKYSEGQMLKRGFDFKEDVDTTDYSISHTYRINKTTGSLFRSNMISKAFDMIIPNVVSGKNRLEQTVDLSKMRDQIIFRIQSGIGSDEIKNLYSDDFEQMLHNVVKYIEQHKNDDEYKNLKDGFIIYDNEMFQLINVEKLKQELKERLLEIRNTYTPQLRDTEMML